MLVCLDPGHGGEDVGAIGFSLLEKNVCLDIAYRLRRKLLAYEGIKVTMTRSIDINVSAEERSRWANEQDADLFLSIHTNASPDSSLSGFASYVSVIAGYETRRIQCWLHNQIACFLRRYGVVDLGKKNDTEIFGGQLPVLRKTKMPAISIASLFITHSKENHLLADSAFLDHYAQCMAEGIARIYKCKPRENVNSFCE
ncbi:MULTISPECIES: N-acetylmuramoyl-L-alanine amidase [Thermoactinomyces]|jgi:N-acetylmuramoyl-L-alanine amidase|uniref:N-acetylmuramoyl-L-alanine amidase n=1 Tax=Thermoactinomyces daqus TaxID=1329516 RepID=A0A7W1X9X1_9BACL|nr:MULTISPECIES: N-acetylmuramoyl-L-alanine amidase [Thermoactinomyces]MBA4542822.1 N-acetylmuramoyl-L-alanine amidase [Thermoactinomyces daqus]MBH8598505.1 N-acetylmuramoyl-L-alanine amidase [Thermoactinomyces sp. CICC 10523]MBH8604651.1 N-acetylmuramoyl-L-alanine amidase [Thermoactinomyces sp. CICC 10522]MBH8606889.1 N-acetylmuramoyl-L-alanine amidase [Thermoactinomyces sp. CICC 10521]